MTGRYRYDELSELVRRITEANSVYTRHFEQIQKLAASPSSLQRTLANIPTLDRSVVSSVEATLRRVNQFATVTPRMNALLGANREFTSILDKIALPNSPLSNTFTTDRYIKGIMRNAGLSESAAARYMQLDRSRMLSASLVAQQKLAVLDRVSMGRLVGADATFRRSTGAHLGRLTRSYQGLMTAAATQAPVIAHAPIVTAYPPLEYFRHIEALESISVPVDEADEGTATVEASLGEAAVSVDDLLRQLDGSLGALLDGARESLRGSNPDQARHVLTSLRELFTHVLHTLAPDDDVRVWSSERDHFHNGRPTRRARLLYVCRNISEGPFAEFVRDDVSAALSYVDLLNAGTHTVQSELTLAQLKSAVARMEALLVFLLQIRDE